MKETFILQEIKSDLLVAFYFILIYSKFPFAKIIFPNENSVFNFLITPISTF